MSHSLCLSFQSITRSSGLFLLVFGCLSLTVHAQVTEKSRPILDVEGNRTFTKQELLDPINKQLDEWALTGSTYIRTITVAGTDRAATELLQREMLIRDGDILDDELFRESVKRLNSTGLIDPIDADKDVDFRQPDQAVPVMDLIIHVNRATRF